MKIIIGASGYIGNNLFNHFRNKEEVTGTYFRNAKQGLQYFDLLNPNLRGLGVDLKSVDCCLVCSAIIHGEECKKDPKRAYAINVSGTQKVLEQLLDEGIKPVFISSDAVYGGGKGDYREGDERNPLTLYGNHKKIVEDFLGTNGNPLIVRLAKIFGTSGDGGTLLTSWLKQLKQNKEILCATDQIFCPTYIGDLTAALDIALQKNLSGVYNLASPEKFSRYELANMLKSRLKIATGSIKSCLISDLNLLEPCPLDTSMDCSKFLRATSYEFHSMAECMDKLEQ